MSIIKDYIKPPDKLWFPTLLQVSNNVDTNSWFNMKRKIKL